MGVGGQAPLVIFPETEEETVSAARELYACGIRFITVGSASNTIFSDSGFEGAVIKTNGMKNIELKNGSLTCSAGVTLPKLCRFAASNGFGGFHGLCGIPGTVGGSAMTAAGAFGCNIYDNITACKIYFPKTDKTETVQLCSRHFGYRKSPLHGNEGIILSVSFRPPIEDSAAILKKMETCTQKRTASQPKGERSAGSFFKRPENGIAAAFLIDQAGMKGYRIGGAQISGKHAGFIINLGNATEKDIRELSNAVKSRVFEKFGIKLTEEVMFI